MPTDEIPVDLCPACSLLLGNRIKTHRMLLVYETEHTDCCDVCGQISIVKTLGIYQFELDELRNTIRHMKQQHDDL